jgi:hypothetical protein
LVDYYKILELEAPAQPNEIKAAFRRLAKSYHPDMNPGQDTADRFKLVYMAYEVLSDPFKKQLYDGLMQEKTRDGQDASGHETFDYDKGFGEWRHRASERATHYANMRYKQFEKEELRGFDLLNQQIGLSLAIMCFFFLGGGTLYFAYTIVLAYLAGKAPLYALLGAIALVMFGLLAIWQVNQLAKVFVLAWVNRLKKRA